MRIRQAGTAAGVALSLFALSACSDRAIAPELATARPYASLAGVPTVFISEFHYDNTGADVNEKVEVTFPTGTNLTGYVLVPYNGANGQTYTPTAVLSALTPAACVSGGRSVVTAAIAGLQNGTPDGIALIKVNAPGDTTLVEFLSYEGAFVGTNGKANGVLSNNIGVFEAGTEPVDASLQRDLTTGYFTGPSTNTFGACNTVSVAAPTINKVDVTPAAAAPLAGATVQLTAAAYNTAPVAGGGTTIPGTAFTWSSSNEAIATVNASGLVTTIDIGTVEIRASSANSVVGKATLSVGAPAVLPPIRFTELHYDNFGTDAGEGIEIEAPAGTDLTGYKVGLYSFANGATTEYDLRVLSGTVANTCNGRGVLVLEYPSNGIQNGPNDGFALIDKAGTVVEFLSYEGTLSATIGGNVVVSQDIGASQNSAALGTSLQRSLAGTWASAPSNFYGCNGRTAGRAITGFAFSGRDPVTDPALPVGFEAQIFATASAGAGPSLPFTWSSDTPDIASIDADGVIRSKAPGTAIFRATTTDGLSTATYSLPMEVGVQSATAQYLGNAAFGEPIDSDPSDDLIIRRTEYTTSFNVNRNTPNWVAYDLDASQTASGADRCNCFTYDPELPQAKRYTTAAFTGVGSVYNRGHLVRSSDRTTGTLDNARTYYFGNIVPQAADNNQGPWAAFETYLGDLARVSNKEVYILAGVAGNIGTLKDEGKVVIPQNLWKVAVIMPRDQGLANVTSLASIQVIAVIMPNVNGIRDVPWETYKTTVDAVEALSGYDLLNLLRDDIEVAVESNTRPPVAAVNGPFSANEGSSIAMSGAASSDPDNDALSFAWSFGDGATATGVNTSHTYLQDGSYAVRLIVTDVRGLADTIATTATVSNVTPTVSTFAGATLLPGETYSASGSFTDPGADSWTATVNYGDGSGTQTLALAAKQFSLTHTYSTAGDFTVTVRVTDDDATGSRTQTVRVLSVGQALDIAAQSVNNLAGVGRVNRGIANSLGAKIDAAHRAILRGDTIPAINQLGALLNELDALVQSGGLTSAQAAETRTMIQRAIDSLSKN